MSNDDRPAWSKDKVEHYAGALGLLGTPFLGFTIILGFFLSPLIGKIDPVLAVAGGLVMAGSFFVFVANVVYWDFQEGLAGWSTLGFIVGLMIVAFGVAEALSVNDRHRVQCALLQEDMLALRHRRADSRELFDVMHCEVQSVGTLRFSGEWPEKGIIR